MNADVIWSEILDRLVDDVSYSWAEMVFGRLRNYARDLESKLDATRRELERWKTGTQVEGDYVTMRDQIDLLQELLKSETGRSEELEAELLEERKITARMSDSILAAAGRALD